MILIIYVLFDILNNFYHNSDYISISKFLPVDINDLKVFVINLDRTPERYQKVQSQLDKQQIKHSRFKAIDGYDINFIEQSTKKEFSGKQLKENLMFKKNNYYQINCGLDTNYYHAKKLKKGKFLTAG